ncbi:MAG: adenylate/guanylate cyclase domain-containing protein [Gemmataceae bacterium]|nr:adenylate/guanylate cyclase domain-containing protein [Gemmataceae bacterium]
MSNALEYRIYDRQHLVFSTELSGQVELGRQDKGEDKPFHQAQKNGLWRLVLARFDEDQISRKHVLVEPLPDRRLRLTNLSKSVPIVVEDRGDLKPLESLDLPLPVVFLLGPKTVRVQSPGDNQFECLPEVATPPMSIVGRASLVGQLNLAAPTRDVEMFIRWLQTTLGVLQSAATSDDFLVRAAGAVIDLVGLDSGGVLLRQPATSPRPEEEGSGVRGTSGEWKVQSFASLKKGGEADWKPSQGILGKVLSEKRTFWDSPGTGAIGASLMGVKAVVAAPILDAEGNVIGALYGDRRLHGPRIMQPISRLEALLVELLASVVAAGLARVKEQEDKLRTVALFEQFFTPELSRMLMAQPELLEPRDAEVTILVCDIRGYSRISEAHGAARSVEWMNDALEVLSQCVRAQDGALVDYTGDELMAMWGAPVPQPDQARRACQAAFAMLRALPDLNQRWQPVFGEATRLGIGINSASARVGNVGSKIKWKYGAQGNTVNVASRVQGATKYLGCPLVVTQATHAQAGPEFAARRLCQARVVNVVQPVTLYELVGDPPPGWAELKKGYEDALERFENKDFPQAARFLGKLLSEHPHDGPALVLMSRTIQCLPDALHDFDPVWQLPGK